MDNTKPDMLETKHLHVGIDAFLLCGFVLSCKVKIEKFVELGMGDGQASCTLAKNIPTCQGIGFDIEPNSLNAAQQHVLACNLDQRVHCALEDVQNKKEILTLYKTYMGNELADVVITNPPYYKQNTGRISKDQARRIALHQHENSLEHFCATASALLKHHGHFFCIYNPRHMADILKAINTHNLGIRHTLAIYSHHDSPARWILIHAQKNAQNDIKILPSISLYHSKKTNVLSDEILNFCPWINKNYATP